MSIILKCNKNIQFSSYWINWKKLTNINTQSKNMHTLQPNVQQPYCASPENYHKRTQNPARNDRIFFSLAHTYISEIPHSQSWFSGRCLGNFSSATSAGRASALISGNMEWPCCVAFSVRTIFLVGVYFIFFPYYMYNVLFQVRKMYIGRGVCVLSRRDILLTFKGRSSRKTYMRTEVLMLASHTPRFVTQYDIFYYKYNILYVGNFLEYISLYNMIKKSA